MKSFLTFPRLSLLFLALFGLSVAGVFVLQTYWLDPGKRCEAAGSWYDVESRTCAKPIYIPDITGRPAGVTRADASNAKNRELIQLEDEVAQQQRALREQVAREKAQIENRRAQ